jgi:WS/DGAT/MGAT family acyltransferase
VDELEQLSGLDAAFLYLENTEMPLHIILCAVLDPTEAPAPLTLDALRAQVELHLAELPLLTRHLVEVPLHLHRPYWAHDPAIDLDHHLARHTLPAPGDRAQLEAFAAGLAEDPLDRDRPLWRFWLVDGLDDGRVAVLAKVHHSMLDGVAGVDQLVALFDFERQPATRAPVPLPAADEVPADRELATSAALDRVRDLAASLPVFGRTARTAWQLSQAHRVTESRAGGLPLTGPPTPLNGLVTQPRSAAFGRVGMDDVSRIRKGVEGATVNDVLLAASAGGLRRYLIHHEHPVHQPLLVACPVSTRREEHGRPDNRFSAMFVEIPVDEPDPMRRLERTVDAASGAKADHDRIGNDLVAELADLVDPNALRFGSFLYSTTRFSDVHRPLINLIMSNVPGPPVPLYLAGSRLDNVYPLGALMDGAGLNLTVMSYCDAIDLGFNAATNLIADVPVLRDFVVDAFAELREATT